MNKQWLGVLCVTGVLAASGLAAIEPAQANTQTGSGTPVASQQNAANDSGNAGGASNNNNSATNTGNNGNTGGASNNNNSATNTGNNGNAGGTSNNNNSATNTGNGNTGGTGNNGGGMNNGNGNTPVCGANDFVSALLGAGSGGAGAGSGGACENLVQIVRNIQALQQSPAGNSSSGSNVEAYLADLKKTMEEAINGVKSSFEDVLKGTSKYQGVGTSPTGGLSDLLGAASGGSNPFSTIGSALSQLLPQMFSGFGSPTEQYGNHLNNAINAYARAGEQEIGKAVNAGKTTAQEGATKAEQIANEATQKTQQLGSELKDLSSETGGEAQNELQALRSLIKLTQNGNQIKTKGFEGVISAINAGTQVDQVGHQTTAQLLNQILLVQQTAAGVAAAQNEAALKQGNQFLGTVSGALRTNPLSPVAALQAGGTIGTTNLPNLDLNR